MGYTMSKLELDALMCDGETSGGSLRKPQKRKEGSFNIDSEISHVTKLRSEPSEELCNFVNSKKEIPTSVLRMLSSREANFTKKGNFSQCDRSYVLNRFLPVNGPCRIDGMNSRAYVSQFSADGSLFVAGFQVWSAL